MNKTNIVVLIAAFLFANSSAATAQVPAKAFIDVNGGAQPQSQTLDASASSPLYSETAIVNSAQGIDGGALFDISGGYRIRPAFAVGIGFSVFSKSGEGSFIASIPDPLIRNRRTTLPGSASGLKHREIGTHVMAVWLVPRFASPRFAKIDVAIFGGPSFFQLSQDVMTAAVPAGTQTVNVTSLREKGNALGGTVGINLNYMFAPRSGSAPASGSAPTSSSALRYGIGIFLRYAGASADLPSADNVRVGGFQAGGGLRLRF
jgi:hypothetical protein